MTSEARPLVSVVVCAHNARPYIAASIHSVLDQTYTELEIIVVDDGSDDGTADEISSIRDSRVRLMWQPNAGKSVALNRALEMLSGEFYAIQDADDLSHPNRIQQQLDVMTRMPDLAGVFCGHDLMINSRKIAPRFRQKGVRECKKDIEAFRMPAHDPTGFYRMSTVGKVRYDPELRIGQGLDYILRIGEQFPLAVIGECLYTYRVHGVSVTRRDPVVRQRMVEQINRKARVRRGMRESADDTTSTWRSPAAQRDNNLAAHFMESVLDLRRSGRIREAMATAIYAGMLNPVSLHYQKPLIFALLPQAVSTWLRR